ncbi:MAG: 1-(5-phosphoribosyl)-5-((5-phosphoribosylamino)methylideneamino)imidazole-4-carboxamide isomerase, partial [Promethearchaeota archaeon]
MEIIPAIDISDGKCVRLFQGKKGTEKVYYEDPLDALKYWKEMKAKRLHCIDLDGAWGLERNKKILKIMIREAESEIKLQIGGGIRKIEDAIELIEIGAARIIIGTLAIKSPNSIKSLSKIIGPERIIIALDYKKGKIATHGWTKQTNENPFEFSEKIG